MGFIKLVGVLLVLVAGWLVGWGNSAPIVFGFAAWTLPAVPAFVIYFTFLITGLFLGLVLGRLVGKR
ncbi:MAG: hypothetical protein ACI9PX_000419 [Reinekea sp.]